MDFLQDTYRSIAAPTEGLFKDNGSRFIALAYPVESVEEVSLIVSSLRKEYHDARHHCFAYRIGHKRDVFRASDDGEPSGSAGRPILGQIDSLQLSDVLVVVVRYFGGIKLGIPGLIRAYKTSTSDALSKAEIVMKTATTHLVAYFGYTSMNSVMRVIKDMNLVPFGQDYSLRCSLHVRVPLCKEADFREKMSMVGDCNLARLEEERSAPSN